jgi:hypothetical protein
MCATVAWGNFLQQTCIHNVHFVKEEIGEPNLDNPPLLNAKISTSITSTALEAFESATCLQSQFCLFLVGEQKICIAMHILFKPLICSFT